MKIVAVPALKDNYIWLLHHRGRAAVVDPGEGAPVIEQLRREGSTLTAILLTHHHADHVGGVEELLSHRSVPVYGPAAESIAEVDHPLGDGDRVDLPDLGLQFEVLDVGGHTRGHIAYYAANLLFCGDTLFGGGCGRIFEGTPAQMWRSLSRLAALPPQTAVYCAHEYTEANLRFALAVEPDNPDLHRRIESVHSLRSQGQPSVPSTLAEELASNPFLRWRSPAVMAAAERHRSVPVNGVPVNGDAEVFAAIRAWKDVF
jgi:hydroxyacylglutathione hydrolase